MSNKDSRKKLYNTLWHSIPGYTMKKVIEMAGNECCLENLIPGTNDFSVFEFKCCKCYQNFEFSKKYWIKLNE